MIRAARPEDTRAIVALEQQNLGDDAWSESLIAAGVAGTLPTVHYLVAEDDGSGVVVGHAVASVVVDLSELQRISVEPDHRRRGLAGALLTEAERLAHEGGAERMLLEVRADNAGALAFYVARGYVEIDRRRSYYRDGATAVVLQRHLTGTMTP